jgi:hypothetical protein
MCGNSSRGNAAISGLGVPRETHRAVTTQEAKVMTVARSLMNRMILLLLGSTILISCGDSVKPTEQEPDGTSIAVPLSKTAADEIASAEVVVTGPDISQTRQELSVSGREISGTIPRLEPGPSRTFTMNAYDATGVLIYSGSTTVDIAEGEGAQVSITLRRVEPTIAPESVLHELPDGTAGEFTRGSGDHPDPSTDRVSARVGD